MKTRKLHWSLSLVTAAMLLFANRSHALVTSYLIDASNTLAAVRATLTNNAEEVRAAATIGRVLKDLSKPSTTVITDYNLFTSAALKLGPLISQPTFFLLGSNVFQGFTNDAMLIAATTSARVAALNDFVRAKKQASNQLASALAIFNRLSTLDAKVQILVGRQLMAKLAAAIRLVTAGELNPGFALNSMVPGHNLNYSVTRGPAGIIYFNNDVQYTQTESVTNVEAGTYTYARDGLHSADLVLNGPDSTNTVQLKYRSSTNGTFTARNRQDGRTESRRGTFTLD
ncbi:MAG TPA: hypothetical protein VNT99_08930 [Methylomirabilota bacterium]|nr:hypothetical protein [Methylomirabilota bacterium]